MPSDFSGCSSFALRCDVSLRRDSRASILCVSAAATRAAVAARGHALYWGRACRIAGPVAQRLEPTAHNGLVGGSNPPGPTSELLEFLKFRAGFRFTDHRIDHRNLFGVLASDRGSCALQMVWAVMAINTLKHFSGHPEISRRFPDRYTALHQPRRCRVPQRMRNDLAAFGREPCELHRSRESCLNRPNRLPVELNEMPSNQAKALPAAHVCQQARRYRRRWLTLVRNILSLCETIEDPLVKIDEGATCRAFR